MVRKCHTRNENDEEQRVYCLGKGPKREEAVLELQSPWSEGTVALQVPRDCSPLDAEEWVEQGVLRAGYSLGKSNVVEKRVGRVDLSQSLRGLGAGGERTAAQLVERIREWVEERVEESREAEGKGIVAWLEPGEGQDKRYFASAEEFAEQLYNVLQRHPSVSVRYGARSGGGAGAREEWLRRLGESQAVYAAACAAASAACGALTGNPLAAATGATGCIIPFLAWAHIHQAPAETLLYPAGLAGATAAATLPAYIATRKSGSGETGEELQELRGRLRGVVNKIKSLVGKLKVEKLAGHPKMACAAVGLATGLTATLLYVGFPPNEYVEISVDNGQVIIRGGGRELALNAWAKG